MSDGKLQIQTSYVPPGHQLDQICLLCYPLSLSLSLSLSYFLLIKIIMIKKDNSVEKKNYQISKDPTTHILVLDRTILIF